MATSIEDFRTEMMQEFGLAEDNDNEGTSSDAILRYINDANADFVNYRAWTFQREIYTVTAPADSTVSTQFTTASNSVVLGSTVSWPSAGKVLIDYDLITFTANNGTTTLTVTPATINRTHIVGETAILLLAMPANYSKIGNVKVGSTSYFPEDVRLHKTPSPARFWEFKEKGSDGEYDYYLAFPHNTAQKTIYLTYYKKPLDFTDTVTNPSATSYLDVPKDFEEYVNHHVSARIYRHLEEMVLAGEHEASAEAVRKRAAIFDSKQHNGIRVPIRTGWENPQMKLLNNSIRLKR